jgi:hypothetical protein
MCSVFRISRERISIGIEKNLELALVKFLDKKTIFWRSVFCWISLLRSHSTELPEGLGRTPESGTTRSTCVNLGEVVRQMK